MEDGPQICQACLSNDRFLYPLADIKDFLSELKIEATNDGGFCWECKRLADKCSSFISQVHRAQALLKRCKKIDDLKSLSNLSSGKKYFYYSHFDPIANLNITCTETGPILIKQEVTDNADDDTQDGTTESNNELVSHIDELHDIRKTNKPKMVNHVINQSSGNHLLDDNVNMSELPRITLVESITDQTTEPNKEPSITEIIELNIPIHSILVDDETDNHSIVHQNQIDKHLNLGQIENISVEPEEVGAKDKGNKIKYATVTDNSSQDDNILTEHNSVTTQRPNESISDIAQERPKEYRKDQNKAIHNTRNSEQIEKTFNKDVVNVAKKSSKGADTITVKVAFVGQSPGSDVHETRIKEEPVSDAEDIQIEADGINVSNLEITTEVKVEDLSLSPLDAKLEYDLWKKSVMLVYSSIRGHKYASRFLRPITDAIAPGYSKVVRRPMDLSTIRKNIRGGVIRTTAEFQRDLLLMLTNALMYNSREHCIHNMAKDLMDEVKYQLNVLLAVHAHSTLPDDTPTQRPKRHLDTEFTTPTPKRPRVSTVAPRVIKITPKVEKTPKTKAKRKVTPKIEKIVPKVEKSASKVDKISKSKSDKKDKARRKSTYTLNAEVSQKPKRGRKPKIKVEKTSEPPEVFKVPTPVGKRSKRTRKANRKYSNPDIESYMKPVVKIEPILVPKVEKLTKAQIKAQRNNVRTESEALSDFCVAITADSKRDLTREEAASLKKKLEEIILNLALDFSSYAPRFRGKPIIADGVIKLWCEDKKSLTWLKKTVSMLPKKMGKFIVKKQAKLPKKIKSALEVPGYTAVEVIQKVLKAQNPWSQVDSWAVYSAEQRGESMFLVLGIPSTVIPTLLGRQRRLAYSLGSVYVKFYGQDGKLTDLPPELS